MSPLSGLAEGGLWLVVLIFPSEPFRQVPRSSVQPIEQGGRFLSEEVIADCEERRRRGKMSKIEVVLSRCLVHTPETFWRHVYCMSHLTIDNAQSFNPSNKAGRAYI